jgi:hypothetical protein
MKAMMLGVLLGILLPAAGQAQQPELLIALVAGDTTRYVVLIAEDEPMSAVVFDKTTLRTVSGRPRASFVHFQPDGGYALWLMEAECLEKKLRVIAVTTYDLAGKRIDFDSFNGPPLDWMFVIPGTLGEAQSERLCR